MSRQYRICLDCGANLDPEEKCDCALPVSVFTNTTSEVTAVYSGFQASQEQIDRIYSSSGIENAYKPLILYVIAIDFDGTLCENAYPAIGAPRTRIIEAAKQRQREGTKLILWTCRTGEQLDEAVKWCTDQGLYFDAVNENLPEMIARFGGDTRKVLADEYWDDKSVDIEVLS